MATRSVIVSGKKVTLDDNNYVAQGGEGVIFEKNGVVYKIAHNASNIIPEDKINELQVLSDIPNIIIPSKSIYDYKTNNRIGYVMKYLSNTEALCKLFVGNFKKTHNITPHNIIDIVRKMQETLIGIHKRGVVVGDYNDMNILMGDNLKTPYHIDVDSFQTPSFKGTAIMASVQDYTLPLGEFNEFSDWCSFAVVAFQLYCQIHPLKGKHPKFKMNDFEGRQKNNISVFNKEVTIPKFVNMSGIPKVHLDWFKEVFVNGDRSIPPFSDGKINYAVIQNIFTDPNASMVATLLITLGETILDTHWRSGAHHVLTTSGFYYGEQKRSDFTFDIDRGRILMTSSGTFIYIVEHAKVLYAFDEDKNLIKKFDDIDYQSYMVANECLYVMQESGLVQYSFEVIGKLIMIPKVVSTINLRSSKMFEGVVIQDIFGKIKATIPHGYNQCTNVELKEIKTKHIYDAKMVGDWLLVLVSDPTGAINLHKFLFDSTFTKYEHKVSPDVNMRNINAIAMPNGMIVFNTEDEKIELFMDMKRGTKIVDTSPVNNQLKLVNGKTACFIDDNKLYSVSMK